MPSRKTKIETRIEMKSETKTQKNARVGMSLIRNVLGMRRVVEVAWFLLLSGIRLAKHAALSSKSSISDQQMLLICFSEDARKTLGV